jgi:hypothetical protein
MESEVGGWDCDWADEALLWREGVDLRRAITAEYVAIVS